MEEKPPTQAGRDVPRSRTPRTGFGTSDQPTPPSKPAERSPRRTTAAPAVSFQAPANDPNAGGDVHRKPTQRRSEPEQGAEPAAKKASAAKKAPAGKAAPTKAAAKATTPVKAAAEPAPPAKATPPVKAAAEPATPAKRAAKATQPAEKAAEPAKAAPAKRAPKKVPAQAAADRPARAKKANHLDAVPSQPSADATPPAKAMPTHTEATPAISTGDAAPAQAISDATQPAKAAPAGSEPSQQAAQRPPTTFSKLAADPGHAPELLALTAVQTIGPRAKEWATRTREAYPKATDTALARLAADQFTRFTSPNSIVGTLAGSYAPVTLIATTALTHARVILHVAAAYGMDPTDQARAADLLVLTRVHASRDDAEAALAAVQRRQAATTPVQRIGRMVATNAVGWAVVRLASRYFPGTRLLAAALVTRSSARNMADRANTYYSQASHALGSNV